MRLGLNQFRRVIMSGLLIILGCLMSISAWSATQIGFVNVSKVFNSSVFIKEANKKLQMDIANMNQQIERQKDSLHALIKQYQTEKNAETKTSLDSKLKTEQIVLNNLSTSFQNKIRQDEAAGKQHFDELLRAATERVAKAKHINVVVTEQNILYTDKTWIDLTAEVERTL